MTVAFIYICIINIITFVVYGYDKQTAVKDRWRVPEKTLLFLAVIGGSIGALAGMYLFCHKTRKWKFKAGIPVIIVLQCAVMCGWNIL